MVMSMRYVMLVSILASSSKAQLVQCGFKSEAMNMYSGMHGIESRVACNREVRSCG